MREQVAQTVGAPEELHLESQAVGLGGICYRAERESVTSAGRGTRDVSNKSSVENIRCRVKRVGALRDLGVRHVMETIRKSRTIP